MADSYYISTLTHDEIMKNLENIPKRIRDRKIIQSAKKASMPIQSAIRGQLNSISKKSKSKDVGSKAAFIARQVGIFTSKSKSSPGAAIYMKGLDVQMYGNLFWNVSGAGILLGEGSYKVNSGSGRFWKTRDKRKTGKMKGFGNFFEKGFNSSINQASSIFNQEIDKIVKDALYNG